LRLEFQLNVGGRGVGREKHDRSNKKSAIHRIVPPVALPLAASYRAGPISQFQGQAAAADDNAT
jgi:hypothetical protein